ncbi:MAG TPA: VCBS repeat-containing protein, partial [Chthoniobacteraceae bacterium]
MTKLVSCLALFAAAALAQAQTPGDSVKFNKIQLTKEFWGEGSTSGDFNHDGKLDFAYGPYWWEGPDFKVRHTFYSDAKKSKIKNADGTETEFGGYVGALGHANEYADNFFEFSYDFNGDGWDDILVIGFPGKEAFWYENPKGGDGPWQKHLAWDIVDDESPWFTDLLGNGKPVLVCAANGYLGYAQPDPKNPNAKWTWHNVSPKGSWQRYTHGLGVGDVN